ncbi:MAG TPA: immunoglobulin domain-containing protein, partial [Verrucomicrobiae bacterium]
TNATLVASNIAVGFWDPFASLTDNTNLDFGLIDNLRVEVPAIPPAFTNLPLAQSWHWGDQLVLTAAATGLPAVAYQWQFNGTNLPGATAAVLTVNFFTATNAGNYRVVASNAVGQASSGDILMTLTPPTPARFTVNPLPDHQLRFTLAGDAYWVYTVESSPDMVHWTTYTNLTCLNGTAQFTITPSDFAPAGYFRARVGP